MADISLKRLKKDILDKSSKLTDKELFTSRAYSTFAQNALNSLTLSFNREYTAKILYEESGMVANTDSKVTSVNANSPFAYGKTRVEKHEMVRGFLGHEAAHNLYTDFKLTNDAQDIMAVDNILYPEPDEDEIPEYKKVKAFLEKYGFGIISRVWFKLINAIEDAHIERRIVVSRPGYKKYLNAVNKVAYEKHPSFEEQVDEGYGRECLILNLILIYAKYGKIKAKDTTASEVKLLLKIKPYIDKAVSCKIAEDRMLYMNEVFCKIFFIIEDIIKKKEEEKEKEKEKSEKKESESESESTSEETSAPSGKEESDEKDAEDEDASGGSDSGESESEGESTSEEMTGSGLTKEEMEKALEEALESSGVDADELSKEMEETSKKTSQPVKLEEGESTFMPDYEAKPEEDEKTDKSSASIESLEMEAAEDIVIEEVEEEIEREAQELDDSIKYDPSFHRGVSCKVIRTKPADNAESIYNEIASELLAKSKVMEKELKKQIKDAQDGGKLDGLYSGQRIDAHSLTRTDKKIFYRNNLPEDVPHMAVMLLIDESGSMGGNRIEKARETAIILYNFCIKVGVPISIIGHTESCSGRVELRTYAEFDSVDKKDKYRLMGITSRANNRDGYALRYCAEKLWKRKEETKLLFVISDGQPAASGYTGSKGKADVQNVVSTFRKKGMNIITAGIGSDRKSVEAIYNQGLSPKLSATYLDVSDMDKLPKIFIKTIKKFIEKDL